MHFLRIIHFLTFLLLCLNGFGQVDEKFDDGELDNDPQWLGNVDQFIIENGQLNSHPIDLESPVYLSTENALATNVTWQFKVPLNFNPSNNNHVKIFLTSDIANLSSPDLNGYFIRIGENLANDGIDLYKQKSDGTIEKLIDGPAGQVNEKPFVNVRVTRDHFYRWEVTADLSGSDDFSEMIGIAVDDEIKLSSYFGIVCNYTSSNKNNFYFDDLYVGVETLDPPPVEETTYREVVINEIYPDPNPPEDLPDAEFIEIFNTTDKTINLHHWKFADQIKTVEIGEFSLLPLEHVILCKKSEVEKFDAYGNVIGLAEWPSLNNSGDVLSLKDATGRVVDSVRYSSDWYNDATKAIGGWTLEQTNPFEVCSGSNNWQVSLNPSGGTPGRQNSVYDDRPDISPPKLLLVNILESNALKLEFNEVIRKDDLNMENFRISENISISGYSIDGVNIILQLDTHPQPGRLYHIFLPKISDCAGNILERGEGIFGLGVMPLENELIITEIMADPLPSSGLPQTEFIELFNRSDKVLSLDKVIFSNGKDSVEMPDYTISPREYLIVTKKNNATAFNTYGKTIGLSQWFALNDAGSQLHIINPLGHLIFSIAYTRQWYNDMGKNSGGWSLEMIDHDFPCKGRKNWTASIDSRGGTPGKENSVMESNPDLTGPELTHIIANNNKNLTVAFDEKLDQSSVNTAQYIFDPVLTINEIIFDPFKSQSIQINIKDEIIPKTTYQLVINNLTDCAGNLVNEDYNSANFALPEKADSFDVIINEVLFNPRPGGKTFVEIYNRSDKPVNIRNWLISTMNGEHLDPGHTIIDQDMILYSGEHLALTEGPEILKADYPAAKNLFSMKKMPKLKDENGNIVILDQELQIIDFMIYDEKYHHPLIEDIEGVTLERISFDSESLHPDNWHSAASSVNYATPGYVNSQLKSNDKEQQQVSIDPSVIVPDNSGIDDFASINYRFSKTGFVANVEIYDAMGHRIKQIAQNVLLGSEGFFTWDGTNDRGNKANVGYYLVYFEVYNLNGEVIKIKKPIVVGTKF